MSKPSPANYPAYAKVYVDQVPEEDLYKALKNQSPDIKDFLLSIQEDKSAYAYAEGKWTIKEVLQHIIDAERIFSYRALCFARGEKISLPGFEENDYAASSNANRRSWQSLVTEFIAVRQSTELLFESFTGEMLTAVGVANNNPGSVDGIGFTLIGHVYHHMKVIKERYLSS